MDISKEILIENDLIDEEEGLIRWFINNYQDQTVRLSQVLTDLDKQHESYYKTDIFELLKLTGEFRSYHDCYVNEFGYDEEISDNVLKIHCYYKDGLLDGSYMYYSQLGNLVKDYIYKENKKHGLCTAYFDKKGDKIIFSEAIYCNDVLIGSKKKYYPDGKLSSELINVKEYFISKEYYDTGELKYYKTLNPYSEGPYSMLINGVYKRYDKDGTIKLCINYINGKIQPRCPKLTAS